MTTSNRRSNKRIAVQATQLALATPQVVAYRMARMATAGANPSARDRDEFQRMGAEKIAAFGESWNAMAWQMLRANQALTLLLMRSWWSPSLGNRSWLTSSSQQFQNLAMDVLSAGMGPVSRRASANAKRLGKTRKR